ncbi:MAG: 2'-deoxycytidine 5'-triphosphate deaminase domain-containing protein [Alphaproteobacteria bacterium]
MPYLNRNEIKDLILKKSIKSINKINNSQLQPASLDLTISTICYRIKASFIPNEMSISLILKDLVLNKIDLKKEFLLEKGCIYLCEINEYLNLPIDVKGKSNPKSTTGRLDIFTRIITEKGSEYDYIDYNYKGKLYLEIIPQSFSIKIKKNISLNQVRFFQGKENEIIQRKQKLSVSIRRGLVSAYKAKKITSSINLQKLITIIKIYIGRRLFLKIKVLLLKKMNFIY